MAKIDKAKSSKALLGFGESLLKERNGKSVDFVEFENNPEQMSANSLLLNNNFAFLLAVIYDQGQPAKMAWRYPYEFCKHINNELPHTVTEQQLLDFICKNNLQKLDGIFLNTVFKLRNRRVACPDTIRAANRVITEHDRCTSNIWKKGDPAPQEIIERLEKFSGIAQKKSSMAMNILYRDLKLIDSMHARHIDVSYDTHIKRVFKRIGLTENGTFKETINAARELNPCYPGSLDLPAWEIGRKYCHKSKTPECTECPIGQTLCRHAKKSRGG